MIFTPEQSLHDRREEVKRVLGRLIQDVYSDFGYELEIFPHHEGNGLVVVEISPGACLRPFPADNEDNVIYVRGQVILSCQGPFFIDLASGPNTIACISHNYRMPQDLINELLSTHHH